MEWGGGGGGGFNAAKGRREESVKKNSSHLSISLSLIHPKYTFKCLTFPSYPNNTGFLWSRAHPCIDLNSFTAKSISYSSYSLPYNLNDFSLEN